MEPQASGFSFQDPPRHGNTKLEILGRVEIVAPELARTSVILVVPDKFFLKETFHGGQRRKLLQHVNVDLIVC